MRSPQSAIYNLQLHYRGMAPMQVKHTSEQRPTGLEGQHDMASAAPQWRILIADDDPYIRQLLELALNDNGYEVVSASDGYELVRLAQERVPSLILVDL